MDLTTLDLLRAEIDALKARAQDQQEEADLLKSEVASLKAVHRAAARSSRRRLAAATLAAGLAVAWSATPEARAQFGLTLAGLNARLMAVEAKTAPVAVLGTDYTISGMNVLVVDGTGSTNSTSGLGNLTVGYNARRGDKTNARSGSHNLILGDQNNYTSYGGLVAGEFNEIGGAYATVGGGSFNTAGGAYATVGGGQANSASGIAASVGGGQANSASGSAASVGGGYSNAASGIAASVGGGLFNTAGGDYASVGGGDGNAASGIASSVGGGLSNTAGGADQFLP